MQPLKVIIAGATNMGLVRGNNEDNFTIAGDLSTSSEAWTNNALIDLGPKGALLVVADGMGGANAGEVASQIAINTVRSFFSPGRITDDVLKDTASIQKFMSECILSADASIKAYGDANPESKGMGTTIVMAWAIDKLLYVSWCGDSRAYVYNQDAGLHQITKDHSYVQLMVDQEMMTREEMFDAPRGNVITRSLCHGQNLAVADMLFRPYTLSDGDIVLLCTDGLCGMIRDNEIEQTIKMSPDDMAAMAENLIQAALRAGGRDNVTVALMEVVSGAGNVNNADFFAYTEALLNGRKPEQKPRPGAYAQSAPQQAASAQYAEEAQPSGSKPTEARTNKKRIVTWLISLAVVFILGVISPKLFHRSDTSAPIEADESVDETTTTVQPAPQNAPSPEADSFGNTDNAPSAPEETPNNASTPEDQAASEGNSAPSIPTHPSAPNHVEPGTNPTLPGFGSAIEALTNREDSLPGNQTQNSESNAAQGNPPQNPQAGTDPIHVQ